MQKIHSLLASLMMFFIIASVNAQSTHDSNRPFGFCTVTSRTQSGTSFNLNGGGGWIYDNTNGNIKDAAGNVVDRSRVIVLKATDVTSNAVITNAIANYSVVVFDGSAGDFMIPSVIQLKNTTNKTLLGINNARLCTSFVVTQQIRNAIATSGAHSASTEKGTGGKLSNGSSVDEQAEFLTRQAIIDATGDKSEAYRKSGIFDINSGCSNIIVRNLKFVGPGAIDASGTDLLAGYASNHVWVDHCEFSDGMDGNFDITKRADFFTVSWCKFYYTDRSVMHQNTNLVGSSDTEDTGYLNTTFAFNQWGAGCKQRMPMARVGKIHLLNNLYNCNGNQLNLCVNPRKNSEFLVEGCDFSGIPGNKTLYAQDGGVATLSNNTGSLPGSAGYVTVPYSYTVNTNANGMRNELLSYTGATLNYTKTAATDSNPDDYTSKIINANLNGLTASGGKYGAWSYTMTADNGPKYPGNGTSTGAEFWRQSDASQLKFSLQQTVSNLPAGTYKLTVKAANSLNGAASNGQKGRAMLFANYSGSEVTNDAVFGCPSVAIDVIEGDASQNLKEYNVFFTLTETKDVTLGLMTYGPMEAKWFLADYFTLTYYGKNSTQKLTGDATATLLPVKAKKAFDFIVGTSGDINQAVKAANGAGGSGRYHIFVPRGSYQLTGTTDNTRSVIGRSNVSIIGENQTGTILWNKPTAEGISVTSTIEFNGSDCYMQDLTLRNDLDYYDFMARTGNGRAVAYRDNRYRNVLKNVSIMSYQDTFYSNGGNGGYWEDCTIAGTVDFLCGGGNYYFKNCNILVRDRSGEDVICAPKTAATEKYGYVFESCTISGENGSTNQAGRYTFGRPWGGSPAATFLNTKLNILPTGAGWRGMNAGYVIRFHEYGSKNSSGALINLGTRSISACQGAANSDNPVLTAAQAANYTMWNVLEYDAAARTQQVSVANVHIVGSKLVWNNNNDAICWVVFKNGKYYANPITNSLELIENGTYTVRAANEMGGLGPVSPNVVFSNSTKGQANATVSMTHVDYDNPNTSYGKIAVATSGYNSIVDNTVIMPVPAWGANHIAYLKVDASNIPNGKYIQSATLTIQVSGSTDGKRGTAWGVGYNNSAWSENMTYNTADKTIKLCGGIQYTTTTSSAVFETKTFDITEIMKGRDNSSAVVNVIVYETAAAGGYVKNPTVSVIYSDDAPIVNYEVGRELTWEEVKGGNVPFLLVRNDDGNVLYGTGQQNLAMDEPDIALLSTNPMAMWKIENSEYAPGYYFRGYNLAGRAHSAFGGTAHLNSQPNIGKATFVLNTANGSYKGGQDFDNGAVWNVTQMEGGYAIQCVGNNGFLAGTTTSAEPVAWKFYYVKKEGDPDLTAHKITYVLGDGVTGKAPTQGDLIQGATFAVASGNGFTKGDYTFAGWNDGSKTYAPGDTYTMGANDVTLTAVWNNPVYAWLDFTAAVQGGSNDAGTSLNQNTHYYNNWGTASWAGQAYLGFNVKVPAGKKVKSATLKFTSYCGGKYDGRTVDVYCLAANDAALFDKNNPVLSDAMGTKVGSATDNLKESLKTFNVTDVVKDNTKTGATTTVIFQLGGAAAGAYVYGKPSAKAPVLEVELEDDDTKVITIGTNGFTAYSDAKPFKIAGDADGVLITKAEVDEAHSIAILRPIEGDEVPAGEGVIFYCKNGAGKTFAIQNIEHTDNVILNNALVGVTSADDRFRAGNNYVLATKKSEGTTMFYIWNGTISSLVGKCYLNSPGFAKLSSMSIFVQEDEDDETSLREVMSDTGTGDADNDKVAYNAIGQRVKAGSKGLVIIKNMKTVNR